MLNRTGVTVLGILAVVGIAAAIVATRGGTPTKESSGAGASTTGSSAGAPVFPDLNTRMSDVAQVTIKRAPIEFTIKKDGDTWRVVEKGGYPAKVETVRSVVIGLSQLKREEEKTSRPEQYSKLGVEDPTAPPPDAADKAVPQSALVTLKDEAGKPIAAAVLGNAKYGGTGLGGASSQQMFLRVSGEKAAWLVSANVDVPREPVGWLDTKFVDIKRPRIKSFVITHPDGSVVNVGREKQADTFAVRDIPAGKEVKDIGAGESLAATMSDLSFQDVAPAASLQPPPPNHDSPTPTGPEIKPGPTIVLRTFDGLIVTAKSVSKEAKMWWTLVADVDESLVVSSPPPAADAKTSEPPPAAPAVGTLEALRKESSELNAAWAPYAFAPAEWKVRPLNTTLADMLKDPAPATPPGTPSPVSPAGIPQSPIPSGGTIPMPHP